MSKLENNRVLFVFWLDEVSKTDLGNLGKSSVKNFLWLFSQSIGQVNH